MIRRPILPRMKALIFDCDGVLVDSEVIYKASERSFLEKVGLIYETREFFRRFMGRSEESFFEEAGNDHMALHGRPLPAGFKQDLLDYQNAAFEKDLAEVPGMRAVVESFTGRTVAVASSSPTELLRWKLEKTDMIRYFGHHIYSARMVAHGKPEPDLFLYTAKKLQVDAKDCIVIEDSENGVIAGIRAGMQVVGFTGGGHCPPGHDETLKKAGAIEIATAANELLEILNRLQPDDMNSRLRLHL